MRINEIITESKNKNEIDIVYEKLNQQRSLLLFLKQTIKTYKFILDGNLEVTTIELFNKHHRAFKNYNDEISILIKQVERCVDIQNKEEMLDKINKLRLR